jgi:DNA modification methylase
MERFLGKVACGDCLELMRELPDGCCDAVVTDPPYNVGLRYAGDFSDTRSDYAAWCAEWFTEARRVSRCVAFTPGTPNVHLWLDIAEPDVWLCNYRPNGAGYSKAGFCHWEPILVYGELGGERGTDVIRAAIIPEPDAEPHPCPKPLEWARQLARLTCPFGGTVLDPFMGSGTTAVACIQTGRQFIGFELDAGYCAVAEKRIADALAQPRLDFDPPARGPAATMTLLTW